jgi:hypothetical protein
MDKRVFVVSVYGGLCNRLRVLISAIAYCEKFNCTLLVRWPLFDGFMATLPDLFDCPYRSIGPRTAKYLRYAARAVNGLHADLNYDGKRVDLVNASHKPRLVTYVETIEKFGEPYLDTSFPASAHRLVPVPEILSAVRGFDDVFRHSTVVGVNIRHTNAHSMTLDASPPEWFIARIRELQRSAPHLKVFLSCDSPAVSDQVRQSVTCQVLALDKPFAFNSKESIRAAVADLYLLGQAKYILGSYWSSFSDTAFEIRGNGAFETSRNRSLDDSQIARLLNDGP